MGRLENSFKALLRKIKKYFLEVIEKEKVRGISFNIIVAYVKAAEIKTKVGRRIRRATAIKARKYHKALVFTVRGMPPLVVAKRMIFCDNDDPERFVESLKKITTDKDDCEILLIASEAEKEILKELMAKAGINKRRELYYSDL
jgi:hypothetical protein